MRTQIAVFLGLLLTSSSLAVAQTKTVTNADLEKFRQKRLQSEREYRENYERLGFPSPEELEQQRIADEQELIEYSRHLETMRLEREALEADLEVERLRMLNQYPQSQVYDPSYDAGAYYSGGYIPLYNGYYNYRPFGRTRPYGNYNRGYSNPYPWTVIPGFNNRVIRIPQPRFTRKSQRIPVRPRAGGRSGGRRP